MRLNFTGFESTKSPIPNDTKKVAVAGGSMAGHCTGTYLRMNGYDTTIFEMNSRPGILRILKRAFKQTNSL